MERLQNMLMLYAILFAQQSADKGMVTIEVLKEPTFWDYASKYFYIPALIIIIGFIIWRKLKLK